MPLFFNTSWVSVVVLLALTTFPRTGGRAQYRLTLPEARQRAAATALNVLMARQQLEDATLEWDAFRATLQPRLDLTANLPNYYRTSREVTLDDGTIGFRQIELNNSFVGLMASQRIAPTGTLISVESRLQRTDNLAQASKSYQGAPVRLQIYQPLFAFNPWKWDRRLLPLQQTVRQQELIAAGAEAALMATDRFFDLVFADQERHIAELNQSANEQLYAVAEERYALGKINRGDLVQLRLERTSAEQDLLRAERLVAAASAALHQLFGEVYGGALYVPILPDVEPPDIIAPAAALAQMRERRPEILAARLREARTARTVEQTKRDLGPQLNIEAGFGFSGSDQDIAPIYTDPRNERIVSVNFRLPILDGGERRASVRRATAARDLAREIARRTEFDLGTELVQVLEQWRTVQEELRLATTIRDLAEERFTISRESYEFGAIPLTELTVARQIRDRNLRAYVDTLRAYWQTYAQLARLTL